MWKNLFSRRTEDEQDEIHSNYWLGEDFTSSWKPQANYQQAKSHDLYKLSSAKRAIGNFVKIVTGENIPVKFKTKGDKTTVTNGEVVIGSDIVDAKDFDVNVGVALHEGAHVKLTDFKAVKNLKTYAPQNLVKQAKERGIEDKDARTGLSSIMNYIEDRRIDDYIYQSAPGYQAYYKAMYEKFWNNKIVDEALQSGEMREENWDSYQNRIQNLHNENSDLDALKGLRKINEMIDLENIDRLKSTQDSVDLAKKIYGEIMENIPVPPPNPGKGEGDGESDEENESDEKSENQSGGGQGSPDADGEPQDSDSDEAGNQDGDQESNEGEPNENGEPQDSDKDGNPEDGQPDENGEPTEMDANEIKDDLDGATEAAEQREAQAEKQKMSPQDQQKLAEAMKAQQDFLDGDQEKEEVSEDDSKSLNEIDESGTEMKTAAPNEEGFGDPNGIQVIVVKKMTKKLMLTSSFPMARSSYGDELSLPFDKEVRKGIRLGTILGKKLQIRSEQRTTIFPRQNKGKIDKRMIASAGFGMENIFQTTETDQYKKANLHISIDASGSMNGGKWRNTMVNTVALCKAIDMIPNLDVQVSYRTTNAQGYGHGSPYLVMAYDSRVDKFAKVKQLFGALICPGTTPEGLCFDAIMKDFIPATNDMDSYFLNVSDGDPYYSGENFHYSGEMAYRHTKKMVNKLRGMGLNVLSYYVDDYDISEPSDSFKQMYGKDSVAIDVTHVGQITKTMNKLFLQKQ